MLWPTANCGRGPRHAHLADCGQPMRDDEGRAPDHQPPQRGSHGGLALDIQSARRLVQHQHLSDGKMRVHLFDERNLL